MSSPCQAHSQLADLGLIPAKDLTALANVDIFTAEQLLRHFPKRHEDRRRFDAFPAQAGTSSVCIRGRVIDSARKGFGGNRSFHEIVVQDLNATILGGSKITCRWFNMPYIASMIAAGHEIIVHGKPKEFKGRIIIDHPDFEIVSEDSKDSIHLERIVPVYRNVAGIPQRRLREHIYILLDHIEIESLQPPYDLDPTYQRYDAYREIHFPKHLEQIDAARRYFALEEFFALQLSVVWKRQRYQAQAGRVQGKKTELLTQFYHSLPFDLTNAQKRSVKEIIADMRQPVPMNRMLQGDVGSGKTFVALCAMLLAVDSDAQAALMAPTQILAEQHYLTFSKWLTPLGVHVALRTSDRREDNGQDPASRPQVIIGTHALLYDQDIFHNLGLVIVDEQHKFGVDQRAALASQGVMPDVLVMTATPIPRTLTLTLYGDLDVSILDERPAGRGAIVTGVRKKPKVSDVTKFIKDQLAEGRQAYLVYPLVEESDNLDALSAVAEAEKWRKRLSKYEVGLLHGKMSSEEKESVMGKFRDGEVNVLVSTTVIEVGVDVPNANLMVIYNAERFGLAQLHQLRGRIGRGEHKSYCILITDGKSPDAVEKLQVMAQTNDGFKIAEADLRLRGPGDVLGKEQSGLSRLQFVEFIADTELIRHARQLAENLLASDPELTANPQLLPHIHDGDVVAS
ncbi:ATP-dependent DNA helicase RecG [Persicirhabdus sediminis]|uniref:ATP-dependent DNA helicase RecG n=1 Tax=Persicirhabdus sediminis TaxID=454144 RepID=A0A8J7SKM9_9BACT|nr:ATP-dependent DNA helicase RecG [Persicirhabdus sediminis]MBK1790885.1 ATP-dependent DNA helicase RecG [Persicirhabdus sediminis]